MWVERRPEQFETVRFMYDDKYQIGIYLRRADGSAQLFWVIDMGYKLLYAWEYTSFEVWEN